MWNGDVLHSGDSKVLCVGFINLATLGFQHMLLVLQGNLFLLEGDSMAQNTPTKTLKVTGLINNKDGDTVCEQESS